MSFHVGQRVRIVGSRPPLLVHLIGTECYVTDLNVEAMGGFSGIGVDASDGCWVFEPHHLEPINDDDSRELTTWKECVWQPKQVRA